MLISWTELGVVEPELGQHHAGIPLRVKIRFERNSVAFESSVTRSSPSASLHFPNANILRIMGKVGFQGTPNLHEASPRSNETSSEDLRSLLAFINNL
jgi:hypothetical protein